LSDTRRPVPRADEFPARINARQHPCNTSRRNAMKPVAHVRSNISDDGLILLDIRSGRIFSANAIAARIWSGLERGVPLNEIVNRIAIETNTDPAIIARDAASFLDMLSVRSLVEES
jgi:hypothetical protein